MSVSKEDVLRAVEILRAGGLVAFPTETVYGLGADAGNEAAVRRVFCVKGRPEGHPLIVHLSEGAGLDAWAVEVPPLARTLAERFWPGPLTMVFRRSPRVLDVVTGGLPTVALRVPAHPVALKLLRELGGAIAAPSANRFGRVSPTAASHVREDLGGDVDLVLDGGPCPVGIESTIVDLTGPELAVLRPGGITHEEIEQVARRPVVARGGESVRVPGQYPTHYAPRARVVLAETATADSRAAELRARGLSVVVLYAVEASSLYAALRAADREGADVIVVVAPPAEGLGLAVRDRLTRAEWKGEA